MEIFSTSFFLLSSSGVSIIGMLDLLYSVPITLSLAFLFTFPILDSSNFSSLLSYPQLQCIFAVLKSYFHFYFFNRLCFSSFLLPGSIHLLLTFFWCLITYFLSFCISSLNACFRGAMSHPQLHQWEHFFLIFTCCTVSQSPTLFPWGLTQSWTSLPNSRWPTWQIFKGYNLGFISLPC